MPSDKEGGSGESGCLGVDSRQERGETIESDVTETGEWEGK